MAMRTQMVVSVLAGISGLFVDTPRAVEAQCEQAKLTASRRFRSARCTFSGAMATERHWTSAMISGGKRIASARPTVRRIRGLVCLFQFTAIG